MWRLNVEKFESNISKLSTDIFELKEKLYRELKSIPYFEGQLHFERLKLLNIFSVENVLIYTDEEFREVPDFHFIFSISEECCGKFIRYAVSNYGKVYDRKESKFLSYVDNDSYYSVELNHKLFLVHYLVAKLFLGEKPLDKDVIRHLNGNSYDNRSSNLQYGTHKENAEDRSLHKEMNVKESIENAYKKVDNFYREYFAKDYFEKLKNNRRGIKGLVRAFAVDGNNIRELNDEEELELYGEEACQQ